jgi:hypothetical protein
MWVSMEPPINNNKTCDLNWAISNIVFNFVVEKEAGEHIILVLENGIYPDRFIYLDEIHFF